MKNFTISFLLFSCLFSVNSANCQNEFDSLTTCLFPKNESGIKDTLASMEIKDGIIYFVGRKNQPDVELAKNILKNIRVKKEIDKKPGIIEIGNKYEELYLNEWSVTIDGDAVPSHAIGLNVGIEYWLFLEELGNTIFSLNVNSMENPKTRFDFVLASLRNIKTTKNNGSISMAWKKYGRVSALKEKAFFVENIDDMLPFILNHIDSFKVIDDRMEDVYILTILKSLKDVRSASIDSILIQKLPDLINTQKYYVFLHTLAERSQETGINFLVDKLKESTDSIEVSSTTPGKYMISFI